MLDSERDADRQKLARTRWFGAALIPISLGWSWYLMVKPLEEAAQAGQIGYSIKAVLMGPLFLYTGVVLLMADMRDGQIYTIDEYGRKRRTRKAWMFLAGALLVMALTFAG